MSNQVEFWTPKKFFSLLGVGAFLCFLVVLFVSQQQDLSPAEQVRADSVAQILRGLEEGDLIEARNGEIYLVHSTLHQDALELFRRTSDVRFSQMMVSFESFAPRVRRIIQASDSTWGSEIQKFWLEK